MNKIKPFFYIFCFISVAMLFFVFFVCNKAYAQRNFTLKSISVSENKRNNSYFIWFRFNSKPKNILKNMIYKKYGIEAVFNNTTSYSSVRQSSEFVNFKNNKLFKAAEIIPGGNYSLDAIIYFKKNAKISPNDVFASFYHNYLVVKIIHKFPPDIFQNIGKKTAVMSNAMSNNKVKTLVDKKNIIEGAKTKIFYKTKTKTSDKSNNAAFNNTLKNTGGLNLGIEAVKTVVYLALIIAMIYGIYFFMNKFKNKVSSKEKVNTLKIVSSINIGSKKSILLIEVNKEYFLVGVSPSNIQMIGRLHGVQSLQNPEISNYTEEKVGKNQSKETKSIQEVKEKNVKKFNPEAYMSAEEIHEYDKTGSDDTANDSNVPFVSPSPAVKTYGRFSDVMREKVAGRTDYQENNLADISDKANKVKNISEAKFKNKADNIFFDIEERLKGLMENNVKSKKF